MQSSLGSLDNLQGCGFATISPVTFSSHARFQDGNQPAPGTSLTAATHRGAKVGKQKRCNPGPRRWAYDRGAYEVID
ncbi:hypothetical protein PENANT_c025G10788 [Penicillium antarcticum]|uniref:Uncharacterized protein n=1 Tax=Penicillium antarcticum TaxID=416450 RepID=A0A1V6PXK4_9EURO|nr:hypothetical protein PENANT_c025G10788 [Penicillium antarcticum]